MMIAATLHSITSIMPTSCTHTLHWRGGGVTVEGAGATLCPTPELMPAEAVAVAVLLRSLLAVGASDAWGAGKATLGLSLLCCITRCCCCCCLFGLRFRSRVDQLTVVASRTTRAKGARYRVRPGHPQQPKLPESLFCTYISPKVLKVGSILRNQIDF